MLDCETAFNIFNWTSGYGSSVPDEWTWNSFLFSFMYNCPDAFNDYWNGGGSNQPEVGFPWLAFWVLPQVCVE